jgi:hypothetical protein
MSSEKRIQIRLKSDDRHIPDSSVTEIIDAAKRTGARSAKPNGRTTPQKFEPVSASSVEHSSAASVQGAERSPDVDLIQRALGIIGSPTRLAAWMQTSIPALRGRTPYSLLGSQRGRKQVEVVLGRIEHGIY